MKLVQRLLISCQIHIGLIVLVFCLPALNKCLRRLGGIEIVRTLELFAVKSLISSKTAGKSGGYAYLTLQCHQKIMLWTKLSKTVNPALPHYNTERFEPLKFKFYLRKSRNQLVEGKIFWWLRETDIYYNVTIIINHFKFKSVWVLIIQWNHCFSCYQVKSIQ